MAAQINKLNIVGELLSTDVTNNVITTIKKINIDTLKAIPKKVGGHISLYPWFHATITKSNSSKIFMPVVKLCVSNHMYLSGFGGGFKNKGTPYDGLIAELRDEVPTWTDYLLEKMDTSDTLIFSVEQQLDKKFPKSFHLPLQIIIFVYVSAKELHSLPFHITKEVRSQVNLKIDDFLKIVDTTPTVASEGLRIFHMIRNKLRKNGKLVKVMSSHFKVGNPTIQMNESDLGFKHAMVELKNGYKRPFNELIRENDRNFNMNKNKAWKLRADYGLSMLSQSGPIEPLEEKTNHSFQMESLKNSLPNLSLSVASPIKNQINNGFEMVSQKKKNKTANKRANNNKRHKTYKKK